MISFFMAETVGEVDVLSAFAAALIPLIAAIGRDNKHRAGIAILAAIILATLRALADGELEPALVAVRALEALIVQLTTYHGLWKHVGVNQRIGRAPTMPEGEWRKIVTETASEVSQ